MRAIGKFIIIDKVTEETETKSGLVLTAHDMKGFRYRKGVVVTPGGEVTCVKEGDKIYYDKSSGHEMIINDTPRTIILERDVVVVLD